ncbi:MAG: Dabb family protein [Pseudomonadota bacterium]
MAELIALLSWRTGADEAARAAVQDALRQRFRLVSNVLPSGRNAGDLLVRHDDAATDCPADFGLGALYEDAVESADGALFEAVAEGGDPIASPIHRTALFCADRNRSTERLDQFERETVSLPRYVPVIQGWRLGRVTRAWGRFPWSYVWEQGFDRPEHLTHDYMMAAAHWGYVDRWFDPEHPDQLIAPGLCHAFCHNPPGTHAAP